MRRYNEVTLDEDKTNLGVANAMRAGAKEKTTKLYVKMVKLVTVANPGHGPGFLEEVSASHLKCFHGNVVYSVEILI